MQISNISKTNTLSSNDNAKIKQDRVKDLTKFATVGVVSTLAGATHGIYKKINKESISTFEEASYAYNGFITESKTTPGKVALKIAQLKPEVISGAFSIISGPPPAKGPAVAQKILIDNMVNLDDSYKYGNKWMITLQNGLMKLGFNPKNDKIANFVSSYDADVLNQKLKDITGFDFHIEIEPDKGRHKIIHKCVYVPCEQPPIENINIINKPFTKVTKQFSKSEKYAIFKKILNPYDEKVFSAIEKLPFGKKFTDFMRKTNSPIKQIPFFKTKFYDLTSMLKGAGVTAIVGLSVFGSVKYFTDKHSQNK